LNFAVAGADGGLHSLVSKANALMALHIPQQHEVAAVVPPEAKDSTVDAAARSSGKKTGQRKKKFQHHCQRSQSPDKKRSPYTVWRQGPPLRAAMRMAGGGKLGCRGTVDAAGASDVKPGRLFFIFDSVSNKKLLVDTGSSFSLFPFHSAAKPCGLRLKAANRQRLRCWANRLLIGNKSFQWQFLQADVSFPILGLIFCMASSC
jgi:hypothetical protein